MRFLIGALVFIGLSAITLRAEDFPGLKEPLRTVTTQYLVVQKALAADSFDGVTAAATAMKTAVATPGPMTISDDFASSINALAAAKTLHDARLAFHQVSNELIAALALNHVQTGGLHSAYCPMIKGYWIQDDGRTVHNPYYGAAMPDCGEIQRQF